MFFVSQTWNGNLNNEVTDVRTPDLLHEAFCKQTHCSRSVVAADRRQSNFYGCVTAAERWKRSSTAAVLNSRELDIAATNILRQHAIHLPTRLFENVMDIDKANAVLGSATAIAWGSGAYSIIGPAQLVRLNALSTALHCSLLPLNESRPSVYVVPFQGSVGQSTVSVYAVARYSQRLRCSSPAGFRTSSCGAWRRCKSMKRC